MEKIKQVLKITSEYRFHPDNMAKEYVLLENGEFLQLGRDCMLYKNRYLLRVNTTDDGKIKTSLIDEKYTLCYGISLTNIISILANKEVFILGIDTYKDDREQRKYVVTIKQKNRHNPESYYFNESSTLQDFEKSELGYFICDLYGIK